MIKARSTVSAWVGGTLIEFCQAGSFGHVGVASCAGALIRVDAFSTLAAMLARLRGTFVHISLANFARVTRHTNTAICVGLDGRVSRVRAGGAVNARLGEALIDIFLTVVGWALASAGDRAVCSDRLTFREAVVVLAAETGHTLRLGASDIKL